MTCLRRVRTRLADRKRRDLAPRRGVHGAAARPEDDATGRAGLHRRVRQRVGSRRRMCSPRRADGVVVHVIELRFQATVDQVGGVPGVSWAGNRSTSLQRPHPGPGVVVNLVERAAVAVHPCPRRDAGAIPGDVLSSGRPSRGLARPQGQAEERTCRHHDATRLFRPAAQVDPFADDS